MTIPEKGNWIPAEFNPSTSSLTWGKQGFVDQVSYFFASPQSGMGWFWQEKEQKIFPALVLSGNEELYYWVNTVEICLPRGSQNYLEKELSLLLNKYLAHAFNGKLMGMKGILSSWKEEGERGKKDENWVEDIEMMQECVDDISDHATFLEWSVVSDTAQQCILNFDTIQKMMTPFLRRFYNPIHSFSFEVDSPGSSILCPPYFTFFWITSTAHLLALLQEDGSPVLFLVATSDMNDTSYLDLSLSGKGVEQLLSQKPLDKNRGKKDKELQFFQHWLLSFILSGGTWYLDSKGNEEKIVLKIPVPTPSALPLPQELWLGAYSEPTNETVKHFPDIEGNEEEILSLLSNNLFNLNTVSLSSTIENFSRSAFIKKAIHSLPEIDFNVS